MTLTPVPEPEPTATERAHALVQAALDRSHPDYRAHGGERLLAAATVYSQIAIAQATEFAAREAACDSQEHAEHTDGLRDAVRDLDRTLARRELRR